MLYELFELTKVHQGRTVLDIPALTIPAGRISCLIGPNGAGKTTLLHLLAFLDAPTSGEISFRSVPVGGSERSLQPLRRQVVLVDQYPILFTGSVRKNLEFGLKVRKIERKKRGTLIEEALDRVGMLGFADALAHKLSGGETKRVALARALVVAPDVLLCDEPTANVDTENQEIIQGILARANKEQGVSIIFATHSLSQARRLAQQTMVLRDGRLSDLPRENVFVAIRQGQEGGRAVYQLPNAVLITVPAAEQPFTAASARLFLDPARITLVPDGSGRSGLDNCLPARVVKVVAENGGVRTTVDAGVPIDILLSLPEYRKTPPLIGDRVVLHIDDQGITIDELR